MSSKKNRACISFVALCTVCYFVSYITRCNYSAVLPEIVKAQGISKVEASMAVTGSFITYGIGQLISGWLGDRFKPDRIILSGLLISALMNVLVPVFTVPKLIAFFWCVNGFAQALIWPPMVKILSGNLDMMQYKKACVTVNWGSLAGTLTIYLCAPLCIMWKGWKSLFYICAAAAVCFAVIWAKQTASLECRMEKKEGRKDGEGIDDTEGIENKKEPFWTAPVIALLAIIMVSVVLQGILRDGITTWMPTYVSEEFGLDSSISILSGVFLPIVSILFLQLTSLLNRKLIRNELLCAGTVFAIGFFGTFLMIRLSSCSVWVFIGLASLVTGCMHGVNVILVSMVPPYFKKSNKISTVSGLINSCTYVGSSLSSYGGAWVAEQRGWSAVLWLWAAAALLGALLCLGCVRQWKIAVEKKFRLSENENHIKCN